MCVCLRGRPSKVEEELLEQEFLDRCFQEMLEEEDQDWFIPSRDLNPGVAQIQHQLNGLSVADSNPADVVVSFPFAPTPSCGHCCLKKC